MGLVEGTYRLTRDVINPKPDRRISNGNSFDWKHWKRWQEGDKFVVSSFRGSLRLYPACASSTRAIDADLDPLRFPLIVEALAPIVETVTDYLLRRYGDASTARRVAIDILERTQKVGAGFVALLDQLDAEV